MRTRQFWMLWLMLFLSVSTGIMIIGQASPMAQQLVKMTPVAAAGMVGLISIFNGAGRVFLAWVLDAIGRAPGLLLALRDSSRDRLPAAEPHRPDALQRGFAVIGLCYGGGFGTMPSFTADFFGPKYMGGIYGWILLARGAGAIPSPILIAQLRQSTGRDDQAIHTVAVVMLVATTLPLLVRRPAPATPMRFEPERAPADARRRT
jgi:MFS transporter, OFA family, oxalate/formate antiporter